MAIPGNPVPSTLFLFIDESGNFDFSDVGIRYFVMAGVAALSPLHSAAALQASRYRLMAGGIDVSSFHAAEDKQAVRNQVFETIGELKSLRTHVVYGDKHRAVPAKQSAEAIHALFGAALVKFFIHVFAADDYGQVVVVFDQALSKKGQASFFKTVKPQLKALGKPFHIYFQRMSVDSNGQIADYVAWSKFKQLERGEERPWKLLCERIAPSDFDIFRRGHTLYY